MATTFRKCPRQMVVLSGKKHCWRMRSLSAIRQSLHLPGYEGNRRSAYLPIASRQ